MNLKYLRTAIGIGAVALTLAGGLPPGLATAHDHKADDAPRPEREAPTGGRIILPGFLECQGEVATIVLLPGQGTVQGTAGRDVVVGTAGNDTFVGNQGDDLVCFGDGNDTFLPGAGTGTGWDGHDRVYGGGNEDSLDGGTGDDQLYGGTGNDLFYGGNGIDYCDGGPGFDGYLKDAANKGDCQTVVDI